MEIAGPAAKKRKLSQHGDSEILSAAEPQDQVDDEKEPRKSLNISDGSEIGSRSNGLGEEVSIADRPATLLDSSTTKDNINEDQDVPADHEGQSTDPVAESSTVASAKPSADSTEETATPDQAGQPQKPLSKNQQKRLRKQAEWESKREERKEIRKEKQAAKRTRQRAERAEQRAAAETNSSNNNTEAVVPTENQTNQTQPSSNAQKRTNKPRAQTLPITILLDCDFNSLMKDSELVSLAAQITRCYSDNRKARLRAHLGLCGFKGALRKRFDDVLSHYKQWKGIRVLEEDVDFVEGAELAKGWMREERFGGADGRGVLRGAFAQYAAAATGETAKQANGEQTIEEPRGANGGVAIAEQQQQQQENTQQQQSAEQPSLPEGETIYLTSESEHTLHELKPHSTYIIGGLVDKNREKGLCYRRATERGIRTARLPIDEFMKLQSRRVLATNHVCEIMLKWLECGDWGDAFMGVIPKRKGGTLLSKGEGDGGAAAEEGQDEEEEEGGVALEVGDEENGDDPAEEDAAAVEGGDGKSVAAEVVAEATESFEHGREEVTANTVEA